MCTLAYGEKILNLVSFNVYFYLFIYLFSFDKISEEIIRPCICVLY